MPEPLPSLPPNDECQPLHAFPVANLTARYPFWPLRRKMLRYCQSAQLLLHTISLASHGAEFMHDDIPLDLSSGSDSCLARLNRPSSCFRWSDHVMAKVLHKLTNLMLGLGGGTSGLNNANSSVALRGLLLRALRRNVGDRTGTHARGNRTTDSLDVDWASVTVLAGGR